MVQRDHAVLGVRDLTRWTYVLRLERGEVPVRAGQCVTLGVPGMGINREYSMYSAEQDPFIDFLIREVPEGPVSTALRAVRPGSAVRFSGPYGRFVLEQPDDGRRYLFIATGTGIAPFHSFVRTHPALDYRLLHGVRSLEERYDQADFAPDRYVACVSGQAGGDYHGRVTAYLREHPTVPGTVCYLCGNSAMLAEAYDLLRDQGIPGDDILTEAFF